MNRCIYCMGKVSNDCPANFGPCVSEEQNRSEIGTYTIPEKKEKSSIERKSEPIHSGVLCYFPDALAAVSRVSKKGNDKHNPGQPLHWSRDKSNDHLDCVARHIMTPGEIDPDSGEVHLAHAAWRTLAALQILLEGKNEK